MRTFWRLLLVWCMALALPVQGLAAAVMLHCPTSASAQGAAAEARQAQGHAHPASTSPSHGHAHEAVGPTPDDAGHGAASQPSAVEAVNPSCAACMACGTLAALPLLAADWPAPGPASAPAAAARTGVVSFIVAGPERPPRTTLA